MHFHFYVVNLKMSDLQSLEKIELSEEQENPSVDTEEHGDADAKESDTDKSQEIATTSMEEDEIKESGTIEDEEAEKINKEPEEEDTKETFIGDQEEMISIVGEEEETNEPTTQDISTGAEEEEKNETSPIAQEDLTSNQKEQSKTPEETKTTEEVDEESYQDKEETISLVEEEPMISIIEEPTTTDKPSDDGFRFVDSEKPDGEFVFSFEDFQAADDDGSSFTFDATEPPGSSVQGSPLFQRFIELINNPCFDYKGKPPSELFKLDLPATNAEEAFAFLTKEDQS